MAKKKAPAPIRCGGLEKKNGYRRKGSVGIGGFIVHTLASIFTRDTFGNGLLLPLLQQACLEGVLLGNQFLKVQPSERLRFVLVGKVRNQIAYCTPYLART